MPEPTPPARPPISPAKLAANRANAKQSTGPKSPEGKARSRANATKHGLAAAQPVAPPPELEAEFQSRAAAYEDALRPANAVERDLARAAAWGAARFELARRRQVARDRADAARADFDARSALAAAIARLQSDPAAAVRDLSASLAGIDWMIAAWTDLHATARLRAWDPDEWERALALLGRPAWAAFAPDTRHLARALLALSVRGPHGLLDDAMTTGTVHHRRSFCHDGATRILRNRDLPAPAQARATLLAAADEQLARLAALRSALLDAPEPPDPPAEPWHRYEAAARRTWHASLSRLRSLQSDRSRRAADEPNEPTDPPAPPPEPPAPPSPPTAPRASLATRAAKAPHPRQPIPSVPLVASAPRPDHIKDRT